MFDVRKEKKNANQDEEQKQKRQSQPGIQKQETSLLQRELAVEPTKIGKPVRILRIFSKNVFLQNFAFFCVFQDYFFLFCC